MNENTKNNIIVISLCLALFIGFTMFIVFVTDYAEKSQIKACNNIGYKYYIQIDRTPYCSDDKVNLYVVNMESIGFGFKATKVNLYTYEGDN